MLIHYEVCWSLTVVAYKWNKKLQSNGTTWEINKTTATEYPYLTPFMQIIFVQGRFYLYFCKNILYICKWPSPYGKSIPNLRNMTIFWGDFVFSHVIVARVAGYHFTASCIRSKNSLRSKYFYYFLIYRSK